MEKSFLGFKGMGKKKLISGGEVQRLFSTPLFSVYKARPHRVIRGKVPKKYSKSFKWQTFFIPKISFKRR